MECFKEEREKIHSQKVSEPFTGKYASPVVLLNMKDGTSIFSVIYRKLSEITMTEAFPLTRIEDNLYALHGAC